MVVELSRMISLLRCPRSGGDLFIDGNELRSSAGETYPIVNGKPILVKQIQKHHVVPPRPENISKNIACYIPRIELAEDAICLHLGSGDVPSPDKRVISMDILPTDSVDVVAEAEYLPFKSCSFDFLESGAVFEHVYNPYIAASEARRVIKDGGKLRIDTAFMQGYHGFPSHYCNITPQAVETIICDDFILEEPYVPNSGMVTHAIATQLDRLFELLDTETSERLRTSTVDQLLNEFREQISRESSLASQISEYGHRALAASFVVQARKPINYTTDRVQNCDTDKDRADFYAARMGVIQRHHEIELYRKFCLAKNKPLSEFEIPTISCIFDLCKIDNPIRQGAFIEATKQLHKWDKKLTSLRDEVITAYLR